MHHPRVVWENELGGLLACVLAAFAAGHISLEACLEGLEAFVAASDETKACSDTGVCFCRRSPVAAACRDELHLWHASWQRARGLCRGTRAPDLNNSFGWHALPAHDRAFSNEAFLKEWLEIARNGCRSTSESLPVANGPLLRSSRLVTSVERLLPKNYSLIAVTGSGTEAILAFYEIANAYISARRRTPITNASLLFFQGSYIGGAMGLQVF